METSEKIDGICPYCGSAQKLLQALTFQGQVFKRIWKPCTCEASVKSLQEAEQAEKDIESKRREREILSEARIKFREAGLPETALNRKLANLQHDDHNTEAIRKAELLCGGGFAFGIKGLWLQGPVGTGKTTVLLAIAREMAARSRRFGYVYAGQVQRSLIASSTADWELKSEIERRLSYFLNADVYLLDDLGVETRNPATDSLILDIFNTAIDRHKFVCVTSNYTIREYCNLYEGMTGQRIYRRLAAMCVTETIGGTMWIDGART